VPPARTTDLASGAAAPEARSRSSWPVQPWLAAPRSEQLTSSGQAQRLPSPLPAPPRPTRLDVEFSSRSSQFRTSGPRRKLAWVRELIEAAPPLTGEQRRALALLLNSLAPVPARPPGAAVPGQGP